MKDAATTSAIQSIEPHGQEAPRTSASGLTGNLGGGSTITSSGIILAGVHQWRASAFERRLPRTLVPIANRPLVEYSLGWLRNSGVDGVRICANSDTAALRRHLGDGASHHLDIDYYEDRMPRGPAGCIADAARDGDSDCVLVVEGTVIPNQLDTRKIIESHCNAGVALTVVVSSADPSQPANGRIAPAGIYVFSRAALEHVGPRGYVDIKEMLIPRLYDFGLGVQRFEMSNAPLRVTGASSCFVATRRILSDYYATGQAPEGYEWQGAAMVHSSADIHPEARIDGPSLIGPEARIERNAIVIGPTTIGRGVHIRAGAVVCRSILWDDAVVCENTFVDRAILTTGAQANADQTIIGRIVHARTGIDRN